MKHFNVYINDIKNVSPPSITVEPEYYSPEGCVLLRDDIEEFIKELQDILLKLDLVIIKKLPLQSKE